SGRPGVPRFFPGLPDLPGLSGLLLPSVFPIPHVVALLEGGAVLALVGVARSVAVVVVVVAFTIPLRVARIVAVAIARIVAACLVAVAIADFDRARAIDGARVRRRRVTRRRPWVARITVPVVPRDAVVGVAVARLITLPERVTVIAAPSPVVVVAPVRVAIRAIVRVGEIPAVSRVALAAADARTEPVVVRA